MGPLIDDAIPKGVDTQLLGKLGLVVPLLMQRDDQLIDRHATDARLTCLSASVTFSFEGTVFKNAFSVTFSFELIRLERFAFYELTRQPDVVLAVATGEQRLYANILLTVGVVQPQ